MLRNRGTVMILLPHGELDGPQMQEEHHQYALRRGALSSALNLRMVPLWYLNPPLTLLILKLLNFAYKHNTCLKVTRVGI